MLLCLLVLGLPACELFVTEPDLCLREMNRIESRYGKPDRRERGIFDTASQTWHYGQRGVRVEFDRSDGYCDGSQSRR
jgi:hypothetical protein